MNVYLHDIYSVVSLDLRFISVVYFVTIMILACLYDSMLFMYKIVRTKPSSVHIVFLYLILKHAIVNK